MVNKRKNKGFWGIIDWILLFFELASPIVAILCAILIKNEGYEMDYRLATIVAGITIQIVLISVHSKQNTFQILKIVEKTQNKLDAVQNSVKFLNELESIYVSDEERRISFTDRRLNKFKKAIEQYKPNNLTSGKLDIDTYYEELYHMASQILGDAEVHNCSIWAMTTFYDLEWASNDGWEKEWRRKLNEFSEAGIKTTRICLIDNEIVSFLSSSNIKIISKIFEKSSMSLNSSERKFKNFIEYLKSSTAYTKNYFLYINNTAYKKLIIEKGYFGIVLSDGKKFLTTREILNTTVGLTAEYVFDEKLIDDLYNLHKQVCIDSNELLQEILRISTKECKNILFKLDIIKQC